MLLRLLLFAFLLWFIYLTLMRIKNSVFGAPRKQVPKPVTNADPFREISPQKAAVAMMITIAQEGAGVTRQTKDAIYSIMNSAFQLKGNKADKLFKDAEGLLSHVTGTLHLFNNVSPSINKNCSTPEKEQLYEMLYAIATTQLPTPNSMQKQALKVLIEYLEIEPK